MIGTLGGALSGCAPERVERIKVFPVFDNAVDRSDTENLAAMETFNNVFGTTGEHVQVGFSDVFRVLEGDSLGADENYDFDPSRLERLMALSVDTDTPVAFYIQAGGWAISYPPDEGSLTEMLLADPENRMWYADDTPVGEWTDGGSGGLTNLTLYNGGSVGAYREKNIQQASALIQDFYEDYPDLFGGVSVSQEVGFGFPDETHGWTGYETPITQAFEAKYGQAPPREEDGILWREWLQFRQSIVDQYVQQEVDWIHSMGVPANLIYTQQVLPDWVEGREITGNTWPAATVDNGVMGLSVYMYGDWFEEKDFEDAHEFNGEPGWGIMCLSPHDYYDYGLATEMLWDAYDHGAGFIGPYLWSPYDEAEFTMLGELAINGTPYQYAISDFIDELR